MIDTTVPTVTLTTSSASPTASYPIPVTITFSESVTGVALADFTITNGSAHNLLGSGTAYTLDITPGTTGAVSVYFNASGAVDGAINGNSVSNTLSVTFSTSAPLVTGVTSLTSNGSYKSGQTISIQVSFSANVAVTGTPQLTLETGATDAVVNYTSGSGTSTLTFDYTIVAGHNTTDLDYVTLPPLSLNGGTIKDSALGLYDAALTFAAPAATNSLAANKALVVDTNAATVTSVTSTTPNGSYNAPDLINVTINFLETVYVTGTPQITLETGTSDAVASYVSGSASTALIFSFTVDSTHAATDLDYISAAALALNGGTINDLANNASILTLATPGAANSLGSNKAIIIDNVAPTVSSVTASNANGSYTTTTTIGVQVVYSEVVTVTGTPQLSINAGTRTATVNYFSGSATNTLLFNYVPQAGDISADLAYTSTSALALNTGTIVDLAGNVGVLTWHLQEPPDLWT